MQQLQEKNIFSERILNAKFHVPGLRLGLIQSKIGVIQVLKKYEVRPDERTKIPMPLDPKGLTTTAHGGIYLNVRKITTDAA